MRSRRGLAITSTMFLLVMVFAGCVGTDDPDAGDDPSDSEGSYTPVTERHELDFDTSGKWSKTLEAGPYEILPAEHHFVEFDLPLGHGAPSAQVSLGVFMPDVPEGTKVPVVADVGPYYGQALYDPPVTVPAGRLGGFLIENLVPHGFAVAQVSVTGTGHSGGCMDLMGPVEQAGIEAAMDHLGQADWSNGNVGLTGRSYDGSTVWEAAMTGNEHVKTVAPISGLWGQHELMWRNGSAEFRGPGVLWGLYYTFPFTPHEDNINEGFPLRLAEHAACPNGYAGAANAVAAYATGDQVAPELNDYWTDRSFRERMLENYNGSVYFIHGMQDWNVDPHMAFPFYGELEANGLEMKGLFGQWGHNYPDRPAEHENLTEGSYPESVRWDWAQDLLEWFTYYLKEEGPQPELHVEMQDDAGKWRIEETWPPEDVNWTRMELGAASCACDPLETGEVAIAPGANTGVLNYDEPSTWTIGLGKVENDTPIAGLPRLHVAATPLGPGGQLYAELRDKTDDRRIGHAIMDLRLHEGGWETQVVVPGQEITAKMEFFPFDSVVPAGHELELLLANTGRDYLPAAVSDPVIVDLDKTTFRLPLIERGDEAYFTPPGSSK